MYRFSRSIYRELAPRVVEDRGAPLARQHLLDASEAMIRRLAHDRRYFARPARSLFSEVRTHFAISDQIYVWRVIQTNVDLAAEFLDRLPPDFCFDGMRRACRASTRKGTPCQREPLPSRDYCPSHKHLEEPIAGLDLEVGVSEERREAVPA